MEKCLKYILGPRSILVWGTCLCVVNPLRKTIDPTMKENDMSAMVRFFETLAAATRYKATLAISSSPV